jgi:hypothetical protein
MDRQWVRHATQGYEGITEGTTRIKELFEDPSDKEEVRVRLRDGSIRIATKKHLIKIGKASDSDVLNAEVKRLGTGIIGDINEQRIPDEYLVDRERWRAICKARGQAIDSVDPHAWEELCRRRGYLLARHNSRGF